MAGKLLTPITVGALDLPNRVVMAPMTRGRATRPQLLANADIADYYSQRASAGLIITEGVTLSKGGRGWIGVPEIYTAEHVESWKPVTQKVHEAGGRIFCQLWHTGRASHSSFRPDDKDPRPVAPSAIRVEGHHLSHTPKGKVEYETPRALETEEIPQIVEEFKNAAQCARDAGFDGVEIHGANGYLLDTFLQASTNTRTDAYGGSIENRFRIVKEVVEAVTSVLPASRVGLRLSPNGTYNGMGTPDFRESFLEYAKMLSKYGLAYLHVMVGLGFGFHELGEPMKASEFKAVFDGPVIANVGYTMESAEEEISSGGADLVAFGRPFITNPDLVERFKTGAKLASWEEAYPLFYSPVEENLGAKGYSDWPTMEAK